ncbi:hypothetical protein BPO_1582 [Bergeyella porcorum]|uniref:Uncharacterized protein n=1 Tax=Bergeyella porcorum TaxID=1735111 RepID=A0AAU0F439_9FLAO
MWQGRIVFYCNENDTAKAGHEYGFIKFGSRMDVFLPLDTEILCKIGDKTQGGLDVMRSLKMHIQNIKKTPQIAYIAFGEFLFSIRK